jgi:hypothetical protein
MAVEAEEIEQVEDEPVVDETSALDELQNMLDGEPEDDSDESAETEQVVGDDDSADDDSVDETAEAATPEPVVSEGPSFLMKQEAARAGIDPTLIGRAKSDAELELMIEARTRSEKQDDAPEPEPFALTIELPEDEYSPDDPIRKQLATWQQQLIKRDEEVSKALKSFAVFANQQLDRTEQVEAAEAEKQRVSLYSPLDAELDSFESDVLGKTGKLNDKQLQERAAIAETYWSLGARPETPVAEKKRLAALAVEARRKELVQQRNNKQVDLTKQQRRIQGGGGRSSVSPAVTEADVIAEMEKMLKRGKPLLTE